jgi:hypothetical protein
VDEFTEKLALTPLNRTSVISENPIPLMIIVVPTTPLAGEKLEILIPDEEPVTIKLAVLAAVPDGVMTEITPVEVPAGTIAWIDVEERTVNEAVTPLN